MRYMLQNVEIKFFDIISLI